MELRNYTSPLKSLSTSVNMESCEGGSGLDRNDTALGPAFHDRQVLLLTAVMLESRECGFWGRSSFLWLW
jgi:hypothetical protein